MIIGLGVAINEGDCKDIELFKNKEVQEYFDVSSSEDLYAIYESDSLSFFEDLSMFFSPIVNEYTNNGREELDVGNSYNFVSVYFPDLPFGTVTNIDSSSVMKVIFDIGKVFFGEYESLEEMSYDQAKNGHIIGRIEAFQ